MTVQIQGEEVNRTTCIGSPSQNHLKPSKSLWSTFHQNNQKVSYSFGPFHCWPNPNSLQSHTCQFDFDNSINVNSLTIRFAGYSSILFSFPFNPCISSGIEN